LHYLCWTAIIASPPQNLREQSREVQTFYLTAVKTGLLVRAGIRDTGLEENQDFTLK